MTSLLIENCRLRGGRIVDVRVDGDSVTSVSSEPVGSSVEMRLDAGGSTLAPGLVDSHCHPFEYGWLKRAVDLRGTSNITAIRLRLAARTAVAAPGEWVTGMGWDQETFPDRRMPEKADIDDISPNNPVLITRVCGHIALLNTLAIRTLGVDSAQGALYERDEQNQLTGIIKESALEVANAQIPRDPAKSASDLLVTEFEAARMGLTTLHCIISPEGYKEELDAFSVLFGEGTLSLRYRLYIPPIAMAYVSEKGLRERMNGEGVRINGVKVYADGSLGARTAALREPYSDDPSNSGLLRHTDEELQGIVDAADKEGYQVIVHAIGDRAVEQAISALGRVTGARNPKKHRLEHASLLPRDLRSQMANHGIRAAVQPQFATSDTWARRRLGDERVRDLYPFKDMMLGGIVLSGGSDAPIESMNPVVGMWAAMMGGAFTPEQALSLDDALSLYTSGGWSNGGDPGGSVVAEGGPATLTLLDSDIEGMHPALLRKVGAVATVVSGKVVHSAGGSGV